jgi:hypothetical protein
MAIIDMQSAKITKLEADKAKLVAALKAECYCTGERHYDTGLYILCDACEVLAEVGES